jgi:hypothetical protein
VALWPTGSPRQPWTRAAANHGTSAQRCCDHTNPRAGDDAENETASRAGQSSPVSTFARPSHQIVVHVKSKSDKLSAAQVEGLAALNAGHADARNASNECFDAVESRAGASPPANASWGRAIAGRRAALPMRDSPVPPAEGRRSVADPVGPHLLVVRVLEGVAVPHEKARAVEEGLHACGSRRGRR